jgi:hypothetical protein
MPLNISIIAARCMYPVKDAGPNLFYLCSPLVKQAKVKLILNKHLSESFLFLVTGKFACCYFPRSILPLIYLLLYETLAIIVVLLELI